MSRHEGVSCDSCLKGNFRGRRYKCLICYDYDLCATCYEAGATTTRHTIEHPMQCILTHSDFELYYGGEALPLDQPQSFTCPYCGKMGYTESTLQEHVAADHAENTNEVVCPICASQPGGEPNLITDDFTNHLVVEHRNNQRDLISFLDEPMTRSRHVRRIPHPTSSRTTGRRTNMQFSSASTSSSLSPTANRDSSNNVDPIAELLSQLGGVRRTVVQGTSPAHLHHVHMQLNLERYHEDGRQQQVADRLPRRQGQGTSYANGNLNPRYIIAASSSASSTVTSTPATSTARAATQPTSSTAENTTVHQSNIQNQPNPQLLLSKIFETSVPESDLQLLEVDRADRSWFIKDILLTTINDRKKEPRFKESVSSTSKRTQTQHLQTAPAQSSSASGSGSVIVVDSTSTSNSVLTSAPDSVSAPYSASTRDPGSTLVSDSPPDFVSDSTSSAAVSYAKHLEQQQQSQQSTSPSLKHSTSKSSQPNQRTINATAVSGATITTNITTSFTATTATAGNQLISPSSTAGQAVTAGATGRATNSSLTSRSLIHSSSGNNIGNIRDIIAGGSNRKPLCQIDATTLNQTSEPPTSH